MVQLFNLWPIHRKYFYNTDQQMLMFLMTAPTNFIGLPTSIYLYRIEHYFEAFISFFTVLTSFMYHAVDSLDAKFIIQDAQWHRLDNIGAITAFMISAVHLMDNRDQKLDLQLQIGCLFVAILAQEIDPWDLKYTLFPILAAKIMLLGVLKFRARKPQYNKNMLGKSLFFVFLAACCFGIGLDDKNDYLRIFHFPSSKKKTPSTLSTEWYMKEVKTVKNAVKASKYLCIL